MTTRARRHPIAAMIVPQAAREKETACHVLKKVSRIATGITTPARRETGKYVVDVDIN